MRENKIKSVMLRFWIRLK